MTTLATELLADERALWALGPEWRRLWRRAGGSAFQSPDWLLPWWRQFGTAAPRVATVRGADDALLGVLPLYRLEGRLLPIGAGVTDQSDALLAPDYRRRSSGDDEGLDLAAFQATITTTRASFPDLTTTIEDLVVEGDADPDWPDPQAEGEGIVGDLPDDLGRLVVLDGVGHYPHAQAPDELLAAALPFLAEVLPRA